MKNTIDATAAELKYYHHEGVKMYHEAAYALTHITELVKSLEKHIDECIDWEKWHDNNVHSLWQFAHMLATAKETINCIELAQHCHNEYYGNDFSSDKFLTD